VEELRSLYLALRGKMRRRVRLMETLGWDRLIVALSVDDLLIVGSRIIFARRNATLKRLNQLIARSRRTWSLTALAGRLLLKSYSRNLDLIAQHRYLTARRSARSFFSVDISVNRYATMDTVGPVWK
jgi:hypothetical protein